MVLAWRWTRSRAVAGYKRCCRGPHDHGGPAIGEAKSDGPRLHRRWSAVAAPLAHGQALSGRNGTHLTWRSTDEDRCCFRCDDSVASRLAQPALDHSSHGAVDVVDLLV